MDTEEKMTIDERYKYLRLIQPRYGQGTRKERQQLLDEMEAVTRLHRKSLIRLINGPLERRRRRRQRGAVYKADFDDALRVLFETADFICAERLAPIWCRWLTTWKHTANCPYRRDCTSNSAASAFRPCVVA